MKKYTIEIYERGEGDKSPRLVGHYDDLLALRFYACVDIRPNPETGLSDFVCTAMGYGEKNGPVAAVAKSILRDNANKKIVDTYDVVASLLNFLNINIGGDDDND